MITHDDLRNRAVSQDALTARQREVWVLVSQYYRVAQEAPSYGWLARRLSISRQAASEHIEALRRKGWMGRDRPRHS